MVVLQRVSKGGKCVQAAELEIDLSDDIVDDDIHSVRKHFTEDAWVQVEKEGCFIQLCQRLIINSQCYLNNYS